MATCFNPRRSSLGLHFEPTFLKICVHSWDPKQCLQILSMNVVWEPKNVRSFLNKLVRNEDLTMTP